MYYREDLSSVPMLEQIFAAFSSMPDEADQDLITRAYYKAYSEHKDQRRKSKDPYFIHSAHTGLMLAGLINDPTTVAAGLLHDVVEDCEIPIEEIRVLFGNDVARLVDGVTKVSKLKFSNDKHYPTVLDANSEQKIETLRKMMVAVAQDVRVLIIKLCDRLHNMMTLEHLPADKQRSISQPTLDFYAPLAGRLGMDNIKTDLEDLSMRYLYPRDYYKLYRKMVIRAKQDQKSVEEIRKTLHSHMERLGIPVKIEGRRKHLYSLFKKMRSQGLKYTEVYDILAIRIIVNIPEEEIAITKCYEIMGIVHSLWTPISGKIKDYIASPKSNGYRSIHTSIVGSNGEVVEIQIRTKEMHEVNEKGIAAHWKYKESGFSTRNEGEGNWLQDIVDNLKNRSGSAFMDELKRDIYEHTVFCYTPRGEVKELRKDSTVLDLAYHIHSELGHHCSSAKINHRLASIRTKISNGDLVEVMSSPTVHPTVEWLDFVQSARARNKIRQWLRSHQKDKLIEMGRSLLLTQVRARFGSTIDDAKIKEVLSTPNTGPDGERKPPDLELLGFSSFDDMLIELGIGPASLRIGSVLARLEHKLKPLTARPTTSRKQHVRKKTKIIPSSSGSAIYVGGIDQVVTHLARCCTPLHGDPIIGFVTIGRGLTIHRADCRVLANIIERIGDTSRIVNVAWSEHPSIQKVSLTTLCHNRKGLLSDISTAITQLNVEITNSNTSNEDDGTRARLNFSVTVESRTQLQILINRIKSIQSVISVTVQ